jgi:hypothetical protein
LGLGVWYGFQRYNSLKHHAHHEQHEAQQQLRRELIDEGKVAFEAQFNREQAALAAKEGIVIDSESYRFSGDKWANWASSQTK